MAKALTSWLSQLVHNTAPVYLPRNIQSSPSRYSSKRLLDIPALSRRTDISFHERL